MRKILVLLSVLYCGFCGVAIACELSEIDVLGDGTQCETAKFTITTTELTANTTFAFYMSAKGTFYVDWGDGIVDTITRTDTNVTLYDHTYTTDGTKIIRFGGLATEYSTTLQVPAIQFGLSDSNLTTPKLILNIDGSLGAIFPTLGQAHNQQPCFFRLFRNADIKTIPENLFDGVYGSMWGYAFCYAFLNCKFLESIPENLFRNITGGKGSVFEATFHSCTSLKTIPKNLFADITSANNLFFYRTFSYCSGLQGYIPPSLFAGLIKKDSPDSLKFMTQIFSNTNLTTSCPAGTVQFMTGYEDYWNGKVSCVDENLVCSKGEYLPAHRYQCETCPENNYCVGGTYPYSETNTSGATQCPNGLYAPAGMWESAQCGRILHIGDNVVYLRATKKTSPAIHIDIDNDGIADYFGNMTTLDVPMTRGTTRKLKLRYGGITYSVYDDSVDFGE